MADYSATAREIGKAIRQRDLWLTLGSWDVRRMYRRSVLGPLWLTISAAVFVAGVGVLYGGLLRQSLESFLPHVALGFVIWTFLSGSMLAGTQALIVEGAILKQVAIGPTAVVFRVLWRQILVTLHQLAVPAVILVAIQRWPTIEALWVIPGALLLICNVAWMTAFLAIASARFRDIPPIVGSILQIAFFMTPVIWLRDGLTNHHWVVDLNPFSHLIEIVRGPLLGMPGYMLSFWVCTAMAVAGCIMTFILFARSRDRLVYWL
jgi:ABC-type polysaccharide/polyol phosphate export permease